MPFARIRRVGNERCLSEDLMSEGSYWDYVSFPGEKDGFA